MFRWIVFAIIIVILSVVIIRIASSKEPKEASEIIYFDGAENLTDSDLIYRIDVRNFFALGDTFSLSNVIYFEKDEKMQMTLRCKKNRLDEMIDVFNLTGENFQDIIRLCVRVKTKIDISAKTDISEIAETEDSDIADSNDITILTISEVSKDFTFDSDRYEYIRLNFDNIKLDYVNSKVELFIFAYNEKLQDAENIEGIDFDGVDFDDNIGRFTIFDVNMPKRKIKISKFIIR